MTYTELVAIARTVAGFPVVTAAELRAVGADTEAIKRALARRWQAPVRGIYVANRDPVEDHLLALVAVKAGAPGAVLTGLVAARHLGLRWVPDLPGAMVLVGDEVRRRSTPGLVLVRRSQEHGLLKTSDWDGVPVAPVSRVVVDAARQVIGHHRTALGGTSTPGRAALLERRCVGEVRGLVLGALADGRCSREELLLVIGSGSARDSRLLRRACRDAERGAASPPEAEVVDGLLALGVPFACNVELWEAGQLVAVLDIWLVGTGVGGEIDSLEAHGGQDQLDATLRRHNRLAGLGVELLHVTPRRYRDVPGEFHAALLAAADRRRVAGLGDPAGVEFRPRGPVLGRTRLAA